MRRSSSGGGGISSGAMETAAAAARSGFGRSRIFSVASLQHTHLKARQGEAGKGRVSKHSSHTSKAGSVLMLNSSIIASKSTK